MPEVFALDLDEEFLSHLGNPDSWVVIQGEQITDELIFDEYIRSVFEWQRKHAYHEGKPATASVLADEFDLEFTDPETAIGDLLDRLRDRYVKRQGREKLKAIGEAYKADPLQIHRVLLETGRELSQIIAKRGEVFGTGDFSRAIHRYDKKVLAGRGPGFGFEELNDHFYGQRGMTFMIAPPKTYKSWLILQAAIENTKEGQCSWIYPLELPADETDMRIRHLLAGIPWWKYIHNALTPDDKKMLAEASEYIDACGIYRVVKPPEGERTIDEMVQTARDGGADCVYIDQLQYIENNRHRSLGSMNDTGEYFGVLNRARNLSDDGPIWINHQFNRSVMFADKMPEIQQAKGSSAIEETATLALGVWGNKDMRRSNVLELGTLITRNHMFAAWELAVELSHGCSFDIIGRVEDE